MNRLTKIFLLFFFLINSENLSSQPSITWEKQYGYPQSDEGAYDVCESSDGNFFIVGNSGTSFSSGRIYVLKIDQYGDTLWTKKYNAGHYAYSVAPTNDCGCVMTGYGLDSAFTLKIDCYGNIVWQKFYSSGAECYDIQEVSDGGFIVCGRDWLEGYVMKIDSKGGLMWKRNYVVSNQMGFTSCLEAIDGGYIAGGYVSDPDTKMELIRLDTNGEKIWERRFKILNNGGGSITKVSILNDKYLIFGITNGGVFFGKYDLEGFQKSVNVFPDSQLKSLYAASVINDNRFAFTSQIYPGIGDTMYVRNWVSDSLGYVLFEKYYPTTGYISVNSIHPLKNCDILFAGIYKKNQGSIDEDETIIIRTDSTLFSKPLYVKLNSDIIPQTFNLYQNYPNPFNPSTKIKFDISKSGSVELNVYDISGKLVKMIFNGNLSAGTYETLFSASDGKINFASGIYFYEMIFEEKNIAIKKMILIK
ncbi:MAG: T9SS type A sorting domain-containing protein [Ignavibacteria bacterium]